MTKVLFVNMFLISISNGHCAGNQAGDTTPVGGGLTLLLALSLAYAIKQYRVALGKEEEL